MSRMLIVFLVVIVLIGVIYFFRNQTSRNQPTPPQSLNQISNDSSPEPVDYSAYFAIYTNGTFRVFTAAMYHNLSSDIFITAQNPNQVQVKQPGITWKDFFDTLPFELTQSCLTTGDGETFCSGQNGKLTFYLNGVVNNSALDQEIQPGDKLLVRFGQVDEAQIKKELERLNSLSP